MPQSATIESLPGAFRMMKAMQAQGVERGEDYRTAARSALKDVLEARMGDLVAGHLDDMARRQIADRRNGFYGRRLLTELGEIELCVPRTRSFSARAVLRAYARRAPHIDRMVLACFVLGLSTRKVATALLPILVRAMSPAAIIDPCLAEFALLPRRTDFLLPTLKSRGWMPHRDSIYVVIPERPVYRSSHAP